MCSRSIAPPTVFPEATLANRQLSHVTTITAMQSPQPLQAVAMPRARYTTEIARPQPLARRHGPASGGDDTRERTFACDYPDCNKTYLKSSHLKAHYRVHTGTILKSG